MRICVDFDGVIHSYVSGWQGADVIPDPPVDGAFSALKEYLDAGFQVAVFSCRSDKPGGLEAMKNWCDLWGFTEGLEFPTEKPPSIIYIDDRGYHFTGRFPSVEYIKIFKPWNK